MLLPLLVACFLAHGFTVLTLKRSILTEKISRRGYHLRAVNMASILSEILFVREVMRTNIVALPGDGTLKEVSGLIHAEQRTQGQYLYPVVDSEKSLLGVVTRKELSKFLKEDGHISDKRLSEIASPEPVVAFLPTSPSVSLCIAWLSQA